jgi:hypothetical protein
MIVELSAGMGVAAVRFGMGAAGVGLVAFAEGGVVRNGSGTLGVGVAFAGETDCVCANCASIRDSRMIASVSAAVVDSCA